MSPSPHLSVVEHSLPTQGQVALHLIGSGSQRKKLLAIAGGGIGVLGLLFSYYVWRSFEEKRQTEGDLFNVDGELNLFASNVKKGPSQTGRKAKEGRKKEDENGVNTDHNKGSPGQAGNEHSFESFLPITSTSSSGFPTLNSIRPLKRYADPRLRFAAQQARAIRQTIDPVEYEWEVGSGSSSSSSSSFAGEDLRTDRSDREIMYQCAKMLVQETKDRLLQAWADWEAAKIKALDEKKTHTKKKFPYKRNGGKKSSQTHCLAQVLEAAAEYLELVHEKRKIRAHRQGAHQKGFALDPLQEGKSGGEDYQGSDGQGGTEMTERGKIGFSGLFPPSSMTDSPLLPFGFPPRSGFFNEKGRDPMLMGGLALSTRKELLFPKSSQNYGNLTSFGNMMDECDEDDYELENGRHPFMFGGLGEGIHDQENELGSYFGDVGEDPVSRECFEDIKEKLKVLHLSEGENMGKVLGKRENRQEDGEHFASKEKRTGLWTRHLEGGSGPEDERNHFQKGKEEAPCDMVRILEPTFSEHDDNDEEEGEWVSEGEEMEEYEEGEDLDEEEEENEEKIFTENVVGFLNKLAAEWGVTPEGVEALERESRLQKEQAREMYRKYEVSEKAKKDDFIKQGTNRVMDDNCNGIQEGNDLDNMDEGEWEDVEGDENDEGDETKEEEEEGGDSSKTELSGYNAGAEWWNNLVESSTQPQ